MILVTGGTGFVGSHLLDTLSARGMPARCLLRPTAVPRRLPSGVEAAPGDLVTGQGLDTALRGVDTVIHLAGVTKASTRRAITGATSRPLRPSPCSCGAFCAIRARQQPRCNRAEPGWLSGLRRRHSAPPHHLRPLQAGRRAVRPHPGPELRDRPASRGLRPRDTSLLQISSLSPGESFSKSPAAIGSSPPFMSTIWSMDCSLPPATRKLPAVIIPVVCQALCLV